MADRAISALPTASTLTASDLFVLSQSNQAKNTNWSTIISYLTTALDGHGGINDISYSAPASGSLTGTMTITLADGTTETLSVYNGKGISSVTKVAGTGTNLTDTYTITYNDNSTYQFTLDNGKSISSIADKWAVSSSNSTEPGTWYDSPQTMTTTDKYEWHYEIITFNDGTTLSTDKAVVGVYGDTGENWYVHIKWSATEPDSDSDMENIPDAWMGIYAGTSETAPTHYTDYSWYQTKGATGDTGNGISSVEFYSSSGLTDTYRVNFTDGTYTFFGITNGSSINYIDKTSTSGLTDTYTVYLTNGTTTTFDVVNGKGITSITNVDVTHAAGHTDVYRINFNDGDTFSFSIYNGANGTGSVSSVDGIAADNQNVPLLTLGSGAPTTSTVGALKSRYFDQTNSILYICTGIDTSGSETTYTWQGAGVTVDSALSSMSTNPVQNAVLTALLGTATLTTTAQTLTGAVNELNSGKVSKSGDTMTGALEISVSNVNTLKLIDPTSDVGTAPSSSYVPTRLSFFDKNGKAYGYLCSRHYATGKRGVWLYAHDNVGPVGVWVGHDGNDNPFVEINEVAAWRAGLGLGTSGALPITIAQGGTGATTAEGAADALGAYKYHAIYSGNGITTSVKRKLSFSSGFAGLLLVTGTAEARCGLYILQGTASAVIVKPIVAASACTITTGTGFFTITASSGTIYASIMTTASLSRISETSA